MYNTVFFDLDGTLTESAPGITGSIAHVLDNWGIPYRDLEELHVFVGPPLHEAIKNYYSFTDEKATQFVKEFREYYSDKGMFISSVYPGVTELLEKIKASGRKIMLATSKPEPMALRILEHFDLMKYFDEAAGATFDNSRVNKDDVINYLLNKLPEEDRDITKIVMVGDRKHDVLGAKAVGMDCIGALYGYGSREELEGAGAKYIAETALDVFDFLG